MSKISLAKLILKNFNPNGIASLARKVRRRFVDNNLEAPEKLSMAVVEITTYCNLKCAGCVRTIMDEKNEWSNEHMSVEKFQRIVDTLSPAELFIPQGIGESTMHPNIVELIRIASKANKFDRIEINTNGLARKVDFYSELFDAGLNTLSVSVDTLDESLIERVRSGTDVSKLDGRLKEFATRFPGQIGIRVTVSKWNKDKLSELLRRLDELGNFNVYLQPFFDMGNGGGVMNADEAQKLELALARHDAEYSSLNIKVEPFLPSKDVCQSPWRSPAITIDGNIKPCCMILHQEDIHFGNALTVPFNELWNSNKVKEFRSQFSSRSPSCCSRCPYYSMRT